MNLDPAAEHFSYPVSVGNVLFRQHLSYAICSIGPNFVYGIDIRELISLEDVMEELQLGPNGGLIYCMEYPFPEICGEILDLKFSILSHFPNYGSGI